VLPGREYTSASIPAVLGGRYRVERDLASGGLGRIQVASDLTTGRTVALKRLRSQYANDSAFTRLLEREYQTLRGLTHPSVIEVYDYGVDAEGPYYTMELLDGSDLGELAPLPRRAACAHLRDVTSSLALLHARRLLHRDVSPRNVRVTAQGRAKLIDFGALCSFGRAPNVIGTAPCVPPEALSLAGLDQRSDLFALGAVAYFVLTGRHAYPVAQFSDLQEAWAQRVPAPSRFAQDVPPELDALVLSLLSLDPVARPSSAGEVIIRLNQIAGFVPHGEVEDAQSYLLNPRLFGREAALQTLRMHAERARSGNGCSVLIEGDEGVGKSRLQSEFLLETQLLGYCAVYAEARADQSPFGLARKLGSALLQAAPAIVQRAFAPQRAVLAHVLPELADPQAPAERLPEDPAERRVRIQTAFIDGLCALSHELPLALNVDDLHAADPGSAAIVAVLSRRLAQKRMLLIATARPQAEASAQLRAFATDAARVRLEALSSEQSEALVRSLFGDVPDVARFAFRLHALSRGNPLLCMELAQHAVEREIVTFSEGTWVVVAEPANDLPASLGESWSAVLSGLPADARNLVEVLCVHLRALTIEQCVALATALGKPQVYAALDALVAARILTLAGGNYRFAHESLREHVRSGLSQARARQLHHEAATVLLAMADPTDAWATFAACDHLMAAGKEVEGADRMAAIAFGLTYGSDALASAADSIERAIEICRREGRPRLHYLWMLVAQCLNGWFIDPGYRIRMQEHVLEALGEATGLALARKLQRWLGPRTSVIAAIAWTSLSTYRARRGTSFAKFSQVFTALSRACTPLMAGSAAAMDVATVTRIVELLEPLKALGQTHIGGFVYDYVRKMASLIRGREAECLALCERNEAMLADPTLLTEFQPAVRRGNYIGLHHTFGVVRALAGDARALDSAEVLKTGEYAQYRAISGQITVTYCAARGDYEQVRAELDRLETESIQGGSLWANEVLLPIMLLPSYDLADDVVGLQQARESLRRWARLVPTLEIYAEAAEILFECGRGRSAEMVARSEAWLKQARPHERIGWAYARAVRMKLHAASGEHERARQLGERTLAEMDPHDRGFPVLYFEVERQLALAETALGRFDAARARLDELIAFHAPRQNPLHLGLLHDALAKIALLTSDAPDFERQLDRARRHFVGTCNPRLLQRAERLAAQGRAVWSRPPAADAAAQTGAETVLQVTGPTRHKLTP
jgi:tetratricopeptide (TPR) repeat protein